MKQLAYLILFSFLCLLVIGGGIGGVVEQTYPALTPLDATASLGPVTVAIERGATEGDPTILLACIIGGLIVFGATIKKGS